MRQADAARTRTRRLQIVPVQTIEPDLPEALGRGEASAITLSLAEDAKAILLDESMARRVTHGLGLPVSGTLGVLLAAKRRGLVPSVRPLLDEMIQQRRRIGPKLYAKILSLAGEQPPTNWTAPLSPAIQARSASE